MWLTDQIREVHVASRGTYGGRRVHVELTLGRGLSVSHGTIELLMSRAGTRGVAGRPRWRRLSPDLVAGDLVKRDFARSGPDQLWVTDTTEHPIREGKVYCAVVLDVYARRVVGWSIDASRTAALVTNALGMAIDYRTPPAGAVIPSDCGVQFGSWAFTGRAKAPKRHLAGRHHRTLDRRGHLCTAAPLRDPRRLLQPDRRILHRLRMKAALPVAALRNAIRRNPVGTVVHSDRGSSFRSNAFVRTIKNNGLVGRAGPSRVGACGDNAAMALFLSLL